MGMLIEGRWRDEDRVIVNGAYERPVSEFEDAIPASVLEEITRAPGRFHLIASQSCPWCMWVILVRQLKGLAGLIPLHLTGGTRVEGYPANFGKPWPVPGADRDIRHLHELYSLSDPGFTGRVTVPVLWDSVEHRILCNDSGELAKALDQLDPPGQPGFTLRPGGLAAAIDDLNADLQDGLFNAVYRAGLAQTQAAYDQAVHLVFETLDRLEERLSGRRFLFGDAVSETDLRLFVCLVRFDLVYFNHFRCSRKRLVDYPALWAHTRDLYQWPGVAEQVDFEVIRRGYFLNDGDNNPHGILPLAPVIDWQAPHGRETLSTAALFTRRICPGISALSTPISRPRRPGLSLSERRKCPSRSPVRFRSTAAAR